MSEDDEDLEQSPEEKQLEAGISTSVCRTLTFTPSIAD